LSRNPKDSRAPVNGFVKPMVDDESATRRPPNRPEATRSDASALEKGLAAVEGAAEGFAEQAREGDLARHTSRAADQAAQTVRQAQEGMGTADVLSPDALSRAGDAVRSSVAQAPGIAEAAREARATPGIVGDEVRRVIDDVRREVAKTVGGIVAAAVLAVFALGFLALAIAAHLNAQWGVPWGHVAVGLTFAILAAMAGAVAYQAATSIRREADEGFERVARTTGERAQAIARPLARPRREP